MRAKFVWSGADCLASPAARVSLGWSALVESSRLAAIESTLDPVFLLLFFGAAVCPVCCRIVRRRVCVQLRGQNHSAPGEGELPLFMAPSLGAKQLC